MFKILKSRFARLVFTVFVAVQLVVACSGGGGVSADGSAAVEDGPVEVSGSVGGGPLVGATVAVSTSAGRQLGSMVSKNDASYRTSIRAKANDYPLLLSVDDGFGLVTGSAPDFSMYSVVMSREQEIANINPFSTLIVKIARLMPGGINTDNINTAKDYVTGQLGFGLDPDVVNDPIGTRITDANAGNLIRASAALGEMVRRTRDTISAAGTAVTGDDVVNAIAADMADGYLDGAGTAAVDPSVSEVARAVSARVLVEASGNNLRVGGIVAAAVIEQAIATMHAAAVSFRMPEDGHIPGDLPDQVAAVMEAVHVPDASPGLSDMASVVSAVPVDSPQDAVAEVLPADTSAMQDAAQARSAIAPYEEAAAVNQVVHAGDTGGSPGGDNSAAGSGPANSVPVISGSPTGSVQANAGYAFQPNAADDDGNVLAFSITNKPDWASFSDTTGRLVGIPADGDSGSYDNIVISVTDGLDRASLPAFSIQVDAGLEPTDSYTVSWKASVALPDETPRSLAKPDGYGIDYDSASGSSPNNMTVADGSTVSATEKGMPPGVHYVMMTTYDDAGRESSTSTEITGVAQ